MGVCALLAGAGWAEEVMPKLKELRLEALAPAAGEVVLRFPDGRLEAIDLGMEVAGYEAVLTKVLGDHAVFTVELDGEQRVVWMYRATEPGKPGRLRMVRLDAPDLPEPPSPVVTAPSPPPPSSRHPLSEPLRR